eukprot:scaffold99784_cov69-Phaeocystis_antarctica.AAC.1
MKTPRGSVTADDASMTSEASMSLTSEASVASAADERTALYSEVWLYSYAGAARRGVSAAGTSPAAAGTSRAWLTCIAYSAVWRRGPADDTAIRRHTALYAMQVRVPLQVPRGVADEVPAAGTPFVRQWLRRWRRWRCDLVRVKAGRAWRLWAARHSHEEAGPLTRYPCPQAHPAGSTCRLPSRATAGCPGRLGRMAWGLGSTHSGGAPQPLRPQRQLLVRPTDEVPQAATLRVP